MGDVGFSTFEFLAHFGEFDFEGGEFGFSGFDLLGGFFDLCAAGRKLGRDFALFIVGVSEGIELLFYACDGAEDFVCLG